MTIITKAVLFAATKHAKQVRKYTGEPYFNHLAEVADLVAGVARQYCIREAKESGTEALMCWDSMIAAAYMHDLLEDTDAKLHEIYAIDCGAAIMVTELTDVSKPSDGNRAARKKKDREHIWKATSFSKIIKLADIISNTRSIVKHDPDFAEVYLEEKRPLLDGMDKTLPLWKEAWALATH